MESRSFVFTRQDLECSPISSTLAFCCSSSFRAISGVGASCVAPQTSHGRTALADHVYTSIYCTYLLYTVQYTDSTFFCWLRIPLRATTQHSAHNKHSTTTLHKIPMSPTPQKPPPPPPPSCEEKDASLEKEGEDDEDEEELDSSLVCPICKELYRAAVRLTVESGCPQRHSFCSECVRISFQNQYLSTKRTVSCPCCNHLICGRNNGSYNEDKWIEPNLQLQQNVYHYKQRKQKEQQQQQQTTRRSSRVTTSNKSTNDDFYPEFKAGLEREELESANVNFRKNKPKRITRYTGMKRKQLVQLLKDEGLPTHGCNNEALKERHKNFVRCWNSFCDESIDPSIVSKTEDDVRNYFLARERNKEIQIGLQRNPGWSWAYEKITVPDLYGPPLSNTTPTTNTPTTTTTTPTTTSTTSSSSSSTNSKKKHYASEFRALFQRISEDFATKWSQQKFALAVLASGNYSNHHHHHHHHHKNKRRGLPSKLVDELRKRALHPEDENSENGENGYARPIAEWIQEHQALLKAANKTTNTTTTTTNHAATATTTTTAATKSATTKTATTAVVPATKSGTSSESVERRNLLGTITTAAAPPPPPPPAAAASSSSSCDDRHVTGPIPGQQQQKITSFPTTTTTTSGAAQKENHHPFRSHRPRQQRLSFPTGTTTTTTTATTTEKPPRSTSPTNQASLSSSSSSFTKRNKRIKRVWACDYCTYENLEFYKICQICSIRRKSVPTRTSSTSTTAPAKPTTTRAGASAEQPIVL